MNAMPANANESAQFASCTWMIEVIEAVSLLGTAVISLAFKRDWFVDSALALAGIWFCFRAWRDRGRPCVEVRDGRVLLYSGGRIWREVDLSLLVGVRPGWNKTILLLQDGTQVPVDHAGFATSDEAARFRNFMEEAAHYDVGVGIIIDQGRHRKAGKSAF